MKLKDLNMWTSTGPLARAILVAASVSALAATSVLAFDNMSPEQRAALEANAAAAAEAAAGEASASEGGERTIFDGVFTEDQADRGARFFGTDCSGCHGNTARGTTGAPGLIAYTFDNKYANQPLYTYFDYMRTNMPPGNAGWFTDQEYADITAYLLELHGAPAGDTELEGTEEALSQIMIVPTP